MLSNACAQLGAFGCGASCNLPRGGVVASVHGAAGAGVAGGGAAGSAVAVAAFSARLLRCFRRRVPRSCELLFSSRRRRRPFVFRSSVRCLARFGSSLFGFLRVFSLAGSFSLRQACSRSSCIGLSLFAR